MAGPESKPHGLTSYIPQDVRNFSDKIRNAVIDSLGWIKSNKIQATVDGFILSAGINLLYSADGIASGHLNILQLTGNSIGELGLVLSAANLLDSKKLSDSKYPLYKRLMVTSQIATGIGSIAGIALFESSNYDLGLVVTGISSALSLINRTSNIEGDIAQAEKQEKKDKWNRQEILNQVLIRASEHDPILDSSMIMYLNGTNNKNPHPELTESSSQRL